MRDFAQKKSVIEGQENFKKNRPKEDSPDMGRRAFLKFSVLGAAAVTVGSKIELLEKLQNYMKDTPFSNEDGHEDPESMEDDILTEDESISISEVIDYDNPEKFSFDPETSQMMKNHWKKKFSQNHSFKKDLLEAVDRMEPWKERLADIFSKEGVPEKFVYLAIPESHFNLARKSRKNAVGPYQFTADTARKYGLEVKGKVDERTDPVKSGKACAKLLKDLFEVSNDWDIALSAYNGGFAWEYLNKAYAHNDNIAYSDFLDHLSKKANEIRDEIKRSNNLLHEIRKGETAIGIAKKYNISLNELLSHNHINDSSRIKDGSSLLIPIREKDKKMIFNSRIAGLAENLSYPAKCNAFFELIEENDLS